MCYLTGVFYMFFFLSHRRYLLESHCFFFHFAPEHGDTSRMHINDVTSVHPAAGAPFLRSLILTQTAAELMAPQTTNDTPKGGHNSNSSFSASFISVIRHLSLNSQRVSEEESWCRLYSSQSPDLFRLSFLWLQLGTRRP